LGMAPLLKPLKLKGQGKARHGGTAKRGGLDSPKASVAMVIFGAIYP